MVERVCVCVFVNVFLNLYRTSFFYFFLVEIVFLIVVAVAVFDGIAGYNKEIQKQLKLLYEFNTFFFKVYY